MIIKLQKAKKNDCGTTFERSLVDLRRAAVRLFVIASALALLPSVSSAAAAATQTTDYFATHFFDTSTAATYSVRVQNPVRATNPVCAMVYVFDSSQTLQECCGCPLRSDQMETFSLGTDLTGNPFGKSALTVGAIEIVASSINHGSSAAANGGCDPAAGLNPTPTLRSWLSNDSQGTSDPFLNAPLDAQEETRLPALCASSMTIGTPAAICSCGN